jgi:2-phospho-L-lactate guanylyltransferase
MSVAVLIPVNRLDRAKGRLSQLLGPAARRELALITLRRVVDAATGAGCQVTLLCADDAIAAAFEGGVAVARETPELDGLNAQLTHALAGREEVLILHADLPLATAADIRRVIARAPEAPSVTLVRSGDGGTNAMLLRPPGRFALAYGRGSHALHVAAARAAGMATVDVRSANLALDLDTPVDVEALLALPRGARSPAGRFLAAELGRG